ncbi:RDD family protein [Catenuloplanes sp. NPDC051500]|uniref:RDD family protein n=1 Tax=Catenuloplanes sp. NPDC051500 TaxID=3363959 RepID=UPI00379D848C
MSEQPQYPQYPPPFQGPQSYPGPPAGGYQLPPPAAAPDGRLLADPGHRLGARVVDSIVYLVVGSILAGIIGGGLTALVVQMVGDQSNLVPITGIGTITLVLLGFQYVYEVEIPLRWNGQTPGKRMLKIAMVSIEPYGVLTRGRLTYRFLVALGFTILSNCYVGFVDALWCLWDKPYRQCLHDKPAKTVVIRLQTP